MHSRCFATAPVRQVRFPRASAQVATQASLPARKEGDVGDFILNFLAHIFESVSGGLSSTEGTYIWAGVIGAAVLVVGMLLVIYLFG
jgi:hypothetical protein